MAKTIHALIVGINAYPATPLFGCVNDALELGTFLKRNCPSLEWRPHYLLAPHPEDETALNDAQKIDPAINNRSLPTRENIIAGLKKLAEKDVKPGDICLFYYSGHGRLEKSAPELEHYSPSGMNETLVCMDSTDNDNRDLIDKELAYFLHLIRKQNPGGHLLVITDSCHSGGATRSTNTTTRDRRLRARDIPTPFEFLEGVAGLEQKDWFYTVQDGKAYFKTDPRHIHLAAARSSETAKEQGIGGRNYGIFTWNLLRVLSAGGTTLSYAEIMRRTESLVRNMINNQIPQLEVLAGAQASESFLGGDQEAVPARYPVVFQNKQWRLNAGLLNGIVKNDSGPTMIKLLNDGREVEVKEVYSNYSLLDESQFSTSETLDITAERLAVIESMPLPRIVINIDDDTVKDNYLDNFTKALSKDKPVYCQFAEHVQNPAFTMSMDNDGNYMLLSPDSKYPVFLRQKGAGDFINYCNAVGRWHFVNNLNKASMEGVERGDIEIILEVLDNIDLATVNTQQGSIVSEDNVVLTYKVDSEGNILSLPALRCSVKLKNLNLWVGGLYVDAEFGIASYLTVRQNDKADSIHKFEFNANIDDDDNNDNNNNNIILNAIPLFIDSIRLEQGFREVTDQIKIFISNQSFSLIDLAQNPLPLDRKKTTRGSKGTKGSGFPTGFRSNVTPDWMTITIPVKIRLAEDQAPLQDLNTVFTVSNLPDGFEARASLTSIPNLTRGFDVEKMKFMVPPPDLWGDSAESPSVFSSSVLSTSGQSVNVMELTDVKGELSHSFPLNLNEPCLENEVIVAYGYNQEADAYLPVGISDNNKQVEIYAIPSETPGQIQAAENGEKDLGSSVKMFFKKLVRHQDPNTLTLIRADLSRTSDPGVIKAEIEKKNRILLVTHGWLGDTDKIVEAVMKRTKIHESYDVVLAYDYENLNTKIQDTAKDLANKLREINAFDPTAGRRLTLLGSSMGGMVCRWMLEMDKVGVDSTEHLYLVAAPNLGTDIAPFRKRLFGLIGKAMTGAQVLKPYLIPLSILGKKAEKELWVTLDQLNEKKPNDLLDPLNQTGQLPPEIKCTMLSGSVKDMTLNQHNEGSFWKRFWKFVGKTFLDIAVFKGEHDMINPLKSQVGSPWFHKNDIITVQVDHMSYYLVDESLKELEKALFKLPPVANTPVIAGTD